MFVFSSALANNWYHLSLAQVNEKEMGTTLCKEWCLTSEGQIKS